MVSNNSGQENGNRRRLGIHPEFEGIVMRYWTLQKIHGKDVYVRKSFLFDAAEAAFAYFSLWSLDEKQESLKDTVRYVRENQGNPNTISLPTMEQLYKNYSDKSIDETVEEIWALVEKGVKQEHDGMDKLLTKELIGGEYGEPKKTRGGVWHATVGRRGDERLEDRAREIRLTNATVINGEVNVTGLKIVDPSPIHRDRTARERRHGYDTDTLQVVGFHPALLCYHINELDLTKRRELRLPRNYEVIMPYDFDSHEHLVIEAVARRYARIKGQPESERKIFAVSTYLNDHPEIFSQITKRQIKNGDATVGASKLLLEDEPHRAVLRKIENLLVDDFSYRFDGFAVDFREYGEGFQTVSLVYAHPDKPKKVHVLYDGKFDVPPLLLFKISQREFETERQKREQQNRGNDWTPKDRPETSPFAISGQWYPDFDRHSQEWLITRIVRPHQIILEQFPGLKAEYRRFTQQLRT